MVMVRSIIVGVQVIEGNDLIDLLPYSEGPHIIS